MAKVFIEESTLTKIGDAIRGKTGKTELIDPAVMDVEITNIPAGGGGQEVPDIVLSGYASYACAGAIAGSFISMYPTKVTTNNLSEVSYMFYNYTGEHIPFDLNIASQSRTASMFEGCSNLKATPTIDCKHTYAQSMNSMFKECYKLKNIGPVLNAMPDNISYMFSYCQNLRELPDDFFDTWNFNNLLESSWSDANSVFTNCPSLRAIPKSFFEKLSPGMRVSYGFYSHLYNLGYCCCALDEVVNIPLSHEDTAFSSDAFSQAFTYAHRLKRLTFATNEDGTPKVRKWSGQRINLAYDVGYGSDRSSILDFNSGITADKEVTSRADYEALKNDPDWFTTDISFSRYNHDSAVETINSLPDTSAYGTNTITFKGEAGCSTDGGAINTLTEEEIAVAAAKGWTVSLV